MTRWICLSWEAELPGNSFQSMLECHGCATVFCLAGTLDFPVQLLPLLQKAPSWWWGGRRTVSTMGQCGGLNRMTQCHGERKSLLILTEAWLCLPSRINGATLVPIMLTLN